MEIYRNGFVWHDLSENDLIFPAHGHEYVLKGAELLLDPAAYDPKVLESASSRSLRPPPKTQNSSGDSDFPVVVRRRNQSWSSIDLHEYKVYKVESIGESAGKAAADASTQTDDKRRRRRQAIREEEETVAEPEEKGQRPMYDGQRTELSREEISPPPSDSSPEFAMEMLLLLLPLLNSSSVKSFLRPFSKDKSSSSAEDDSTCPICQANPTTPFLALPCEHK